MACTFNHPCPIFCPNINLDCQGNEVINPVLSSQFGFFSNGTVTVSAREVISVFPQTTSGKSVTASPTVTGAIQLLPGNYQVSYFASSTNAFSVALNLNGVQIPFSETNGNSVSKTIIISVNSVSTLTLTNLLDQTIFSSASVTVINV